METDGYSKDDESEVSSVGGKDFDGGFLSTFKVRDLAFEKYDKDNKPSHGERYSGKPVGLKVSSLKPVRQFCFLFSPLLFM